MYFHSCHTFTRFSVALWPVGRFGCAALNGGWWQHYGGATTMEFCMKPVILWQQILFSSLKSLFQRKSFSTHIYPHKYRVATSIQPFSTYPERSGWIWYTCQASLFHSQSHNGFPVLLLASACVSVDINVTLNSSSFLSTASLCQLFFHKEDQGSQMLYLNDRLSASWKNLCCPLNRQVYLQIQMK